MCCAADVLEGKGVVQVAVTVTELHRRQVMGLVGGAAAARRAQPPGPSGPP